jgi:hypothetical protein
VRDLGVIEDLDAEPLALHPLADLPRHSTGMPRVAIVLGFPGPRYERV